MCAIFGISDHLEASNITYLGLHALQHRGQEGAGIVSSDGKSPYAHRRQGLVGKVFNATTIERLKGKAAIGHTRYSTTGGNNISNLQPLLMKTAYGWLSVTHNGNLVNAKPLITSLQHEGAMQWRAGSTDRGPMSGTRVVEVNPTNSKSEQAC